jgi:hypothetical protein
MAQVVINCLFVILLWLIWALIANHITWVQRRKAIYRIAEHGYCNNVKMHLLKKFEQVSYTRHLAALVTFHNPVKLYPWSIQWAFGDGELKPDDHEGSHKRS